MLTLARLVRFIAGVVFLIIAVAIVLRVVGANPGNMIVRDIHDAGGALAGPFKNVFSVKDAEESMALNWGLAAVVYLIVGALIASILVRLAPRGFRRASPAL